jgi:uncharacterized membrane protein
MEPFTLSSKEAILYLVIFGAAVGLILGLIDLWIASKKGKKNLGFIAIGVCTLLGALMPLLAIIAFVVFLVLILRKGLPPEAAESDEARADVSGSELGNP